MGATMQRGGGDASPLREGNYLRTCTGPNILLATNLSHLVRKTLSLRGDRGRVAVPNTNRLGEWCHQFNFNDKID